MSRLRTIFRCSRRWFTRLCRRRTIRFWPSWSCLRPIGRRSRGWTIVGLRCRRTIRRLSRLRTISRLRSCWPVRLGRTLVRSRRSARPIGRRCGRRLTRSRGVARMARGWCCRFCWRCYLHHRMHRCGWTQRLQLASCHRFSRMRGQCLLLFRKRHRWRRRSFLGDNLAIRNCRWRRSHVARCRSFCSEHAFARWSNGDSPAQWRRCDLLRAYLHSGLCDRLCTGKRVLRNHHHRTLYAAVGVGDVRDVGGVIDNRGVVNVGDLRDVYGRIADVDAIHISFAHVIRRHINFPRT